MFETDVREDVLRVSRADARWLSTGWDGGFAVANAAFSISVPAGWECADVGTYVAERLARAGFRRGGGPVLLTGLALEHARAARLGPVEVVATAGISNPAALPMEPTASGIDAASGADAASGIDALAEDPSHPGTVNLLVGTTRALSDAALANLVAVAAEAKAATLLAETGFPGTTTDAVVAACDPAGDPAEYSGSATPVGAAARACVREAVRASLRSRYPVGEGPPNSVDEAKYGVVTDARAEVFRP